MASARTTSPAHAHPRGHQHPGSLLPRHTGPHIHAPGPLLLQHVTSPYHPPRSPSPEQCCCVRRHKRGDALASVACSRLRRALLLPALVRIAPLRATAAATCYGLRYLRVLTPPVSPFAHRGTHALHRIRARRIYRMPSRQHHQYSPLPACPTRSQWLPCCIRDLIRPRPARPRHSDLYPRQDSRAGTSRSPPGAMRSKCRRIEITMPDH